MNLIKNDEVDKNETILKLMNRKPQRPNFDEKFEEAYLKSINEYFNENDDKFLGGLNG